MTSGGVTGAAAVASAPACRAREPGAGLVVRGPSAESALVTDGGTEISAPGSGAPESVHGCPEYGQRCLGQDRTSALLMLMTTTSSRTRATEATLTPGARCMCRMCAF